MTLLPEEYDKLAPETSKPTTGQRVAENFKRNEAQESTQTPWYRQTKFTVIIGFSLLFLLLGGCLCYDYGYERGYKRGGGQGWNEAHELWFITLSEWEIQAAFTKIEQVNPKLAASLESHYRFRIMMWKTAERENLPGKNFISD